ncbi:hypothetical protein [Streptomyces sp. NRRL F-5053]|uniref:hypothetical protein n=1 Tax=Streptomyces sp. NRRL F-5053 TaxID=1463854 RepID=UPI001F1E671B|nr:hypothetical protein [Streptomyces sp. NRRL F-5053]
MSGDAGGPPVGRGWCVDCERYVGNAMAVAYAQGNSGPGKVLEACIAHAREYAALWFERRQRLCSRSGERLGSRLPASSWRAPHGCSGPSGTSGSP